MPQLVLYIRQFNNVLVGYVRVCKGEFDAAANNFAVASSHSNLTFLHADDMELTVSRPRRDEVEYFGDDFSSKDRANMALAAIRKCVDEINDQRSTPVKDDHGFERIE